MIRLKDIKRLVRRNLKLSSDVIDRYVELLEINPREAKLLLDQVNDKPLDDIEEY